MSCPECLPSFKTRGHVITEKKDTKMTFLLKVQFFLDLVVSTLCKNVTVSVQDEYEELCTIIWARKVWGASASLFFLSSDFQRNMVWRREMNFTDLSVSLAGEEPVAMMLPWLRMSPNFPFFPNHVYLFSLKHSGMVTGLFIESTKKEKSAA